MRVTTGVAYARAALVLAVAIGCGNAPEPAAPRAAAPVDAAATPAPPKDALPGAVERVVQLYEAVAALPVEPSCERTRAAIAAVRGRFAADLALVQRARAERPDEVEALWLAQQPRLAAAWTGLQRSPCAGAAAADPDLLEEP